MVELFNNLDMKIIGIILACIVVGWWVFKAVRRMIAKVASILFALVFLIKTFLWLT